MPQVGVDFLLLNHINPKNGSFHSLSFSLSLSLHSHFLSLGDWVVEQMSFPRFLAFL
jgi:hypothetical protein